MSAILGDFTCFEAQVGATRCGFDRFSYVDFTRQPTGIPRVVLKYIEAGYEWGKLHDVDVVPVIATAKGLVPVRPLPGQDPPPTTRRYLQGFVKEAVNGTAAAAHLREAESSFRAALIEAGAPAAMDGLEAGVSSLFAQLIRGGEEAALRIDVGPGDVIFFPAYWHDIDPIVIKELRATGAKTFILVHDILPITFAKFYKAPWRYQFADNLLAAIRNADGLLAVSQLFGRRREGILRGKAARGWIMWRSFTTGSTIWWRMRN